MTIEKIDYTATPHPSGVIALSLKDAPALIEQLLPVQKLSIDVYREREARQSQTLTTLGSYWKGRKPLVLNKACVLALLLPATDHPIKDLEIFELLMGMDDVSISKRRGLASPKNIVEHLEIEDISTYFCVAPPCDIGKLPKQAPFQLSNYAYVHNGVSRTPTIAWRSDISDTERHALAAQLFEKSSYRELAAEVKRAEDIEDNVSTHIWPFVNEHLGTNAYSFPELVEQLGVMRFGHRPTVADTFSGSGQIPFTASRLGCDIYASDLNPISGMLTWGAINVVGAQDEIRAIHDQGRINLLNEVKDEIDELGFELDGDGWRGKAYLYCLETICPSSGWKVPMLQTLVVSKGQSVVAKLIPDTANKRYDIELVANATASEMAAATTSTLIGSNLVHYVDGVEHVNAITAIRGDFRDTVQGIRVGKNKLRLWTGSDVVFKDDDIFTERLYAIQWVKPNGTARPDMEFRSVTAKDLAREAAVTAYVQENLAHWQYQGWVPDTRIEPGDKTDEPIRTRGWTHWHHLFNPRQLLIAALIRKRMRAADCSAFTQALNVNSRLSRWNYLSGPGQTAGVFDNQALNTTFNYGTRGVAFLVNTLTPSYKQKSLAPGVQVELQIQDVRELNHPADLFITDPPYGDAVKYEEILEFFIAWLRNKPPVEFSEWKWDSRRELAVKGEGHDFKLSMIAAYKTMAQHMPDHGVQILMFTHQSGNIWADMANIVWASGLRVTAAWYIVTETDSVLRGSSNVKGTILLVLRKRLGTKRTNQTDLSYELEEEVSTQVRRLTGLNDEVVATAKRPKDGNLFEDADLQMAGYAAALKVLTKYSVIDGKDMTQEALRPRVAGQKLLVDELIDFAVDTANKALVPHGLDDSLWRGLNPSERFYMKMLDMESRGLHSLDNYQNFAKAFSLRDWQAFMGSDRANEARLRSAVEFGRAEMAEGSDLFNTPTRAVLYALMELQADKDIDDVLAGIPHNLPSYYSERQAVAKLAAYIAKKLEDARPAEASAARVLAAAIDNQRL
jgi:putative DNA methylase